MKDPASGLLETYAQGIRWLVPSDLRERLLGTHGLRLDEWLKSGQAHVVKHGPHRTVYQVALGGLDLHVKHYRLMDLRARLRTWLRPPKARTEFERAIAVAQRRVATITPLAFGEDTARGDCFLLTRSLAGTNSLLDFLERTLTGVSAERRPALRQAIARELGRFLAQIHDAGIIHRDLHVGNLLIEIDTMGRPHFYVIDLHDIRLRERLHWHARRDNLILVNRWFVLRASRTDRLRFWKAYSRAITTGSIQAVHKDRARALETGTVASNIVFWRSRDRRCLATNRYYRRIRSKVARGHAVRDLDQKIVALLLSDPDAPFGDPRRIDLKESRSSSVIQWQIPCPGGWRQVIYKRFRVVAWSDPWTALLRRTPALRSWVFGHGMRERCLPTARPLAVLHRRRCGLSYEGYLLTEMIPNARELRQAAAEISQLTQATSAQAKWRLIELCGRMLNQLHERLVSHRDLKAANILVQCAEPSSIVLPASQGPNGPMWLIDLTGVRFHRCLSRARRVQNLSRLHASFCHDPLVTRADKVRFLRTYLQWGLRGRCGWKDWWREIAKATSDKIARNLRSGRPLGERRLIPS
jgi:tRNA A-37 threonylcarbamoyl transferase component Bud32